MDKEAIEKRIQELEQLEKQYWANLNTVIGAKSECLYWLAKLEEPKKED